ncbi:MAG: zinc-ribbon domain-containing protein [Atopobiaceae bacterium]|nr:zinc-ribbon domain-containing protein [Atopobiaceae bacterium]
MITVDKSELCTSKCLGCTNGGATLCRKWAYLLDDGRVAEPLVERGGRNTCPSCGRIIAMESFRFCPYCGQAFRR